MRCSKGLGFLLLLLFLAAAFPALAAQGKTSARKAPAQPTAKASRANAAPAPAVPSGLVKNGAYLLATPEGTLLAGSRLDDPFIPASTLKLATGLSALEQLGPDFRFATRFFQDADGTLFVQGSGDPFLTSETMPHLLADLTRQGLNEITTVAFDLSAFNLDDAQADGKGETDNPYDAANCAVAVNFNTLAIEVGKDGAVRSGEPQTPTLPVMAKLGQGLKPGQHRISISRDDGTGLHLAAELLKAFQLRQQGHPNPDAALAAWSAKARITQRPVPGGLPPLHTHLSSVPLQEMVRRMLEHSNNFTANQLFLATGGQTEGWPATWAKGRASLTRFLEKTAGLPTSSFTVEEGSGLSRKNRITARAMLALLQRLAPQAGLLPVELDGHRLKSGTLNGVSAFAGYLARGERSFPCVVLLNQPGNTRVRVVRELERLLP